MKQVTGKLDISVFDSFVESNTKTIEKMQADIILNRTIHDGRASNSAVHRVSSNGTPSTKSASTNSPNTTVSVSASKVQRPPREHLAQAKQEPQLENSSPRGRPRGRPRKNHDDNKSSAKGQTGEANSSTDVIEVSD